MAIQQIKRHTNIIAYAYRLPACFESQTTKFSLSLLQYLDYIVSFIYKPIYNLWLLIVKKRSVICFLTTKIFWQRLFIDKYVYGSNAMSDRTIQ